jgi:hypothetical protein
MPILSLFRKKKINDYLKKRDFCFFSSLLLHSFGDVTGEKEEKKRRERADGHTMNERTGS